MMLDNFKKFVPIAFGSLVATTSFSLAADNETRISQLESKVNDISMTTVVGTQGGRTATYHPKAYGHGFFVTGDFLWWKAEQDGLEYADTGKKTPLTTVISIDNSRIREIGFEWGPGFRVGAGYNTAWDGWDIYAVWTHFNKASHSSVSASSENYVSGIWVPKEGLPPTCFKASAHYDLDYNIVDLELGRNFFASHSLSLRPFLGIRGAWIDQHIRYKYDDVYGDFLVPGHNPPVGDVKAKMINDYAAGGLRAGFNTTWHFTRNWGIFGNITGSLLYGEFHVSEKINGPIGFIGQLELDQPIIHEKEEIDLVRGNLELGAGVMWEAYFSKNRYHLMFTASYEVIQWFNQNQLIQFQNALLGTPFLQTPHPKREGDLGLHGGTFSARFDF